MFVFVIMKTAYFHFTPVTRKKKKEKKISVGKYFLNTKYKIPIKKTLQRETGRFQGTNFKILGAGLSRELQPVLQAL